MLDFYGEPRLPRLPKLLAEIRDGQIDIPRFQRPFVWTAEQRLELLESIYRGYPIGTILIWRTEVHRLACYDRLGPVSMGPPARSGAVRQYLIDGHQRLATLFAALGPGLYEDPTEVPTYLLDEQGTQPSEWPIYFDLAEEVEDSSPFRLSPKGAPDATLLPLPLLFDSFALGEFRDRLRKGGHGRAVVNRIQHLVDRFTDYVIPVMPIATDDLDQVTISFKRINSGGTVMDEVHMLNALTWQEDFDLQRRIEEISEVLGVAGWGDFPPQMIVNTAKAQLGLDIYKTKVETLAKRLKADPDLLEITRGSIEAAAALLAETCHLAGPKVLPYVYQAVLLADACRDLASLTAEQKGSIREWFWITTLTEHYRGMSSPQFRKAQAHLAELLAGTLGPMPPDAAGQIDPVGRFDFRGSRSRGMALLLVEAAPFFGLIEEELEVRRVEEAGRLLATRGADAMVRLISARSLPVSERGRASAAENRFLLPAENRDALVVALRDLSCDPKRLESHGVDGVAHTAFARGDYVGFLEARRSRLLEWERVRAEGLGLTYRLAGAPGLSPAP